MLTSAILPLIKSKRSETFREEEHWIALTLQPWATIIFGLYLLQDSPSRLVADQVIHRVMVLPPGVGPSCILDLHSDSF